MPMKVRNDRTASASNQEILSLYHVLSMQLRLSISFIGPQGVCVSQISAVAFAKKAVIACFAGIGLWDLMLIIGYAKHHITSACPR